MKPANRALRERTYTCDWRGCPREGEPFPWPAGRSTSAGPPRFCGNACRLASVAATRQASFRNSGRANLGKYS